MTKTNKIRIEDAKEILKSVENPFYWLNSMVKLGQLTESEAGIIIAYGIN
ncbi:MAG: hypothetical protein ACTSVV_10500 [Promethearchaeota archaeon]